MIIYGPLIKEKIAFEKNDNLASLLKTYSDFHAEEAKRNKALEKHVGSEKKFVKFSN